MKAEQTEEPREASVGPVGHKLCYRPGNESGELLSYGAEEEGNVLTSNHWLADATDVAAADGGGNDAASC